MEKQTVRTACLIQARMGSSRLRGKVLTKIGNRTCLRRVVSRVQAVNVIKPGLIDDIIIATTTKPEDNLIEEWCDRHSIDCFRGDSENVLKRYYDCATKVGAEWILRITGDTPFLNPVLTAGLLMQQPRKHYQALAVNRGGIVDGEDAELMSYQELHRVYTKYGHDNHVSTFMRHAGSDVEDFGTPFDYRGIKLSLDTEGDLKLLNQLAEYL